MLKAIIIDDEQYAREELSVLLQENGQVDVIKTCNNAIEGLQQVHALKPDVIFLDIQMPQITGLEMLSMLDPESMPQVVFVTAYDEYALQAFEDNAFDYILKPVEPKRLAKTIQRLTTQKGKVDFQAVLHKPLELIPCAGFNRFILVKPDEIEIASSQPTGVQVLTKQGIHQMHKMDCSLSLKILEEKTALIRCHRQYLINASALREIKLLDNGLAEVITCSGAVAPVSRRYLKSLKERFSLI